MKISDARELYFSLKTIFLHIDDYEKAFLSQYDLTIPRFFILEHIHENPGISYKELSVRLLCTKGNTTRVVGSMLEDGFVVRKTNSGDRRSFHLYLTKKGDSLFKEVSRDYDQYIHRLMSKFDEDQLLNYIDVSNLIENTLKPK
ncbi:MAG: MarR family transcriptional regulator [Chloroflexota bacterium]|nr:MarR family transcriptional regulator [Chloroflexota bacterium]